MVVDGELVDGFNYILRVGDKFLRADDWTLWNTARECDRTGAVVWYRGLLRAPIRSVYRVGYIITDHKDQDLADVDAPRRLFVLVWFYPFHFRLSSLLFPPSFDLLSPSLNQSLITIFTSPWVANLAGLIRGTVATLWNIQCTRY